MVRQMRVESAEKLFQRTHEADKSSEIVNQAILIRDSLNDEDIQEFLRSHQVPEVSKTATLTRAFADKVDPILMNFLNIMVDNHNEEHIDPVLSEYIDIVNRHQRTLEVRIVSAIALREDQIDRITQIIKDKTKRKLRVETEVEPDLIAGFYVLMEGKIFDGTVESQLYNIHETMSREEVQHGI